MHVLRKNTSQRKPVICIFGIKKKIFNISREETKFNRYHQNDIFFNNNKNQQ